MIKEVFDRIFSEFVILALHTGLRIGEIVALKWSDVNFERKTVRAENTKGKKARFTEINSHLLAELKRMKKTKLAGHLLFPFGKRSAQWKFGKACWAARIVDLTFRDLRRTFGTRLLEKGVNIVTIQHLYGHSSVLVT